MKPFLTYCAALVATLLDKNEQNEHKMAKILSN